MIKLDLEHVSKVCHLCLDTETRNKVVDWLITGIAEKTSWSINQFF